MLAVSAAVSICRSTARCSVDWEDNNLRFPEKKPQNLIFKEGGAVL